MLAGWLPGWLPGIAICASAQRRMDDELADELVELVVKALELAPSHAQPLSKGICKYIADLWDPSLRITEESASTFVSHLAAAVLFCADCLSCRR